MITITNKVVESNKLESYSDESKKENTEVFTIKEYVEINDLQQGMIIEGENIHNPVLLFLHGGPGMPEYPIIKSDNLLYINILQFVIGIRGVLECPFVRSKKMNHLPLNS